jgi:hypothetical protein
MCHALFTVKTIKPGRRQIFKDRVRLQSEQAEILPWLRNILYGIISLCRRPKMIIVSSMKSLHGKGTYTRVLWVIFGISEKVSLQRRLILVVDSEQQRNNKRLNTSIWIY